MSVGHLVPEPRRELVAAKRPGLVLVHPRKHVPAA